MSIGKIEIIALVLLFFGGCYFRLASGSSVPLSAGGLVMKILVSPSYGCGWSNEVHTKEQKMFLLTFQPIIDAVLKEEEITDEHPALIQIQKEFIEKFSDDASPFSYIDATDLIVETVVGKFIITEYDGSESITERDKVCWLDGGV